MNLKILSETFLYFPWVIFFTLLFYHWKYLGARKRLKPSMGSIYNRWRVMMIIFLITLICFETWGIDTLGVIWDILMSNTPIHQCHKAKVYICWLVVSEMVTSQVQRCYFSTKSSLGRWIHSQWTRKSGINRICKNVQIIKCLWTKFSPKPCVT